MVDEQTRVFIQRQLDDQQAPTQIVEQLVRGGWSELQATSVVQEVSGVQLAAPIAATGHHKSPLILRILFVFSVLNLLGGIMLGVYAVVAYFIASETSHLLAGSISLLAAVVFAALATVHIAYFFIVKDMKNGSLGAFKLFRFAVLASFVLYLAFPMVATSFTQQPLAEQLVSSLLSSLLLHLIPFLIVLYIGKKHRSYFH